MIYIKCAAYAAPKQHQFEVRYYVNVGKIDWESCAKVLDSSKKRKYLMEDWR